MDTCIRHTATTAARRDEIPGCAVKFAGPHFKELVLETPVDASKLIRGLARRGYWPAPHVGWWFPELANCLLIAVTERRTEDEVEVCGSDREGACRTIQSRQKRLASWNGPPEPATRPSL